MAILLHFNTKDSMTTEDICASLGVKADVVKGPLQILVKTKLLLLSSGKHSLNPAFKNKKIKMNINLTVKSKADDESRAVHESINEDRKMVIQACIVRIMKTRKTMKHNELIASAIDQLKSRFQPKASPHCCANFLVSLPTVPSRKAARSTMLNSE
jgi:cullin 1